MKETKTAWILAKIKTKGFVEAKNINQLALKLDIKPENLRHIIDAIEVANEVDDKARHNYHDYYFKGKGKKKKGTVILCYKWADDTKSVLSDKMNEILGVMDKTEKTLKDLNKDF
jgi:hypothetical protein